MTAGSITTRRLSLSVAEALPKDVGRGIARMDPTDLSTLGVQAGDIVLLVGKRAAAAKVMPTYAEHRGKGIVQIDGLVRQNAQAGLGEQVGIETATFEEAATVVLAPASSSATLAPDKDTRYLARALEGLPLTQGDRVRATLFGGRYQEFTATETSPAGVVTVGPRTVLRVDGERAPAKDRGGVSFEDIGGVHREIGKIREMIELPLKYPELFERLGIDAPKGVLLHGPPGCGKTLIARAVASETDSSFFHVSGPEVIHKFYGESEAHLRAIFSRAKEQSPAVIFIDEIDAIAAKREGVREDQQVERRVVAQLLSLMDGLESRGQVVVIAATNIPQALDPALRRPGRFDREIVIGVPDRRGRLEILEIHSRGMPLASDVSLERLAEMTHGYVGADLEALCREAAMATLRRVMPEVRLSVGRLPDGMLATLEVSMADFAESFRDVEPSALREVFTEIPDVKWDDVGGAEEAKQILRETVEWPLRYPELFREAGTAAPKGILLAGPPGTGKTLLAKAVASESGVNFISVKGPALLSKWAGESERAVRDVFKKAKQASPCVVFFDELDALMPTRNGDSDVTQRVLGQFLTELDGIEELKGVTVLAASNRPDLLDPALLRAGRFELELELAVPDERARREILRIHTRRKPVADDVDLDRLAAVTAGLVGAELEAICRRAATLAIRDRVALAAPAAGQASALTLSASHFERAVAEVKRRSVR